jgi:hypothetical protein
MKKIEKIDTLLSYETTHFIDKTILKNNILKVENILDYNICEHSRVIDDTIFGINLLTSNKIYNYKNGLDLYYSYNNYTSNIFYYETFYNNVDEYGYDFLLKKLKECYDYSFIYQIVYFLLQIEMNRFEMYISEDDKYKKMIYKNNKLLKLFSNLIKNVDFIKLKYLKNIKNHNYKFYVLEIDDNYDPMYFYNTGSKLDTKGDYIEDFYDAHDLYNFNNMNTILTIYRDSE